MQMTVFLPQFVREKKCDDQQRDDQKDSEYYVLVHDSLQLQEIDLIVEHRLYPRRAAPLISARPPRARGAASRCTRLSARLCCVAPAFLRCWQ